MDNVMVISIYNAVWRIEFCTLTDNGVCHLDRQVIQVNKDLPLEYQKRTLVHELLHACLAVHVPYHLKAVKEVTDDEVREHLIIEPLSHAIYQVLADNANLTEWLYG
jgi:Zn-dependent peptidase ImmA (M78 family)